MDHLRTSEERRARWYARHIRPRCIPISRHGLAGDSPHPGLSSASSGADGTTVVGPVPASSLLSTDGAERFRGGAVLRSALRVDGFAVVTEVLGASECAAALDLLWDYLEAASVAERELDLRRRGSGLEAAKADVPIVLSDAHPPPVRRDDPASHSSPHFPRFLEGGVLPFYGSGHSTLAWYLRDRPSVQEAFAAAYEVDRRDLITSLDGMVAWRSGQDHRTDAGWFHLDQNPRLKPGFEAVQGLVNLLPVTEETGGNALVAGSHRCFPHHYLKSKRQEDDVEAGRWGGEQRSVADFYSLRLDEVASDDWLEVDPNDARLLDPDRIVSCLLGPGDMLMWDSRVVHCSYPAPQTERGSAGQDCEAPAGLIRAAGLVSMMPAKRASEEVLRARMGAVDQARTLTHWANKVAPLGEEREDEIALERGRISLMRRIRFQSRCGEQDDGCRCVLVDRKGLTKDLIRLVSGNQIISN